MSEEKDMATELFICVNEAISNFKIKFPDFFDKESYQTVAANSLCMVLCCFIEKVLEDEDINKKLKMLNEIMSMNKKYLKLFDIQNKMRLKVNE